MASMFVLSCGTEKSSGGVKGDGDPCTTDESCGRGAVCLGGACGVAECASIDDCENGQVCITDPGGAGIDVCTAIECETTAECTNGGTCANGICEGGSVIGGQCSDTNPCNSTQTCNAATGKCETGGTPGPGNQCGTCTADAECGAGGACIQLGADKVCASTCENNGACDAGFQCVAFGSVKACVPGKFECGGCLTSDACPEGQHCNGDKLECATTPDQCGSCLTDGDCGSGKRCYGKAASKFCVPECTDTCPANGTCTDLGDGVKGCVWNSEGPCCLGDGCGDSPCANCGGATPFCKDALFCVACTDNSHCTADPSKPVCDNNVCVDQSVAQCTDAAKPHKNEVTGACCQCLNSSHCQGKPCDAATCTCKVTDPTDVCSTCTAPYPGCAEYNGQKVCVQCSENAQCPSDQCNTSSYTCEGTVIPITGDCKEKGCNDPALSCDSKTGLCYDPAGNCDDVTQFCINGGQCISLLEQFGAIGGGGGGLPLPDLGAGGALPGNCECTPGPLAGFDQGNCPDGLTCNQGFFAILALVDPMFKAPYTCSAGLGLPFP